MIGLTVVAFGTSAPELAVSVGASWRGETDLAIGNVVGSNIANVLLVLGIAAVVGGGLVVAQRIVRIDVPIMLALSVLVFVLGLDNRLGRWEGVLFVAAAGRLHLLDGRQLDSARRSRWSPPSTTRR